MPLPKNRSRSVRKVFRRSPKGGLKVHYERRKKGKRHFCSICKSPLQSVSSERGIQKSARRPNRKFGGSLCSACSSRLLVISSRIKAGTMKMEEVDIKLLPYIKRLQPS